MIYQSLLQMVRNHSRAKFRRVLATLPDKWDHIQIYHATIRAPGLSVYSYSDIRSNRSWIVRIRARSQPSEGLAFYNLI